MADEIDSRMEQIRLKNEEIEKKHKEILEDELEAKKQGAIVSLKESPAEKHRYDDVELDFDVKADQLQNSKNPDYKPKSESSISSFCIFTHPKDLLFLYAIISMSSLYSLF